MSRRVGIVASLVFLSSIFFFSHAVAAATVFYVDPDWQSQADGSASAPWTWLDSSAWGTINAALATNDVTIYFSARAASSDVNQQTTLPLNILRTDLGSHLLTLDGMSMYNTNDANPSWAAYSGSSRFSITAQYPVSTVNSGPDPQPQRNNWTLRGFRAVATNGQPMFMAHTTNVIVEDSEFMATPSVVTGPGFAVGFGQNITIRRNHIHDTFGEGIYVYGLYGALPGCCAGDTLLIENNTIHDLAVYGTFGVSEGDGIDIKDGWKNVIVRNNTIYMTTAGGGEDGIITNSAALIEGNFIYNMGRVGIHLAGFYSIYDGFWTGAVIRNNVVVNCGQNPAYSWAYGIAYAGSGTFLFITPQIYNNTIYGTIKPSAPGVGRGIYIGPVTTTVAAYNNIAAGTDGIDFEAAAGTLSTHGNNDYWHAGAGVTVAWYGSNTYTLATITTLESNSLSIDPQFVNTNPPYVGTNFALKSTSQLCGRNMGAILCATGTPQPPTNLRVQ